MKVIISHDVDHLYASEHIFKDLFIEKLWIRSVMHFLKSKISIKTMLYRLGMPLVHNRMNRIDELMAFDKQHNISATYFFGMRNGLGLSYSQKSVHDWIKKVYENGFDVGVHGIDYSDYEKMQREHDDFEKMLDVCSFGIRNHYVRYDDDTFQKMSRIYI